MSGTSSKALAQLRKADARLDERLCRARRTLDPARERATSLEQLGARHVDSLEPAAQGAFTEGLVALGNAIAESFPENVFWDLDALVAQAVSDAADASALRARFDALCALQRQYGRETEIAFRYVHDFIYGYDWAKWLQNHPELAADTQPFGARFLARMKMRGDQLLGLIAADDAKYPSLPEGQARNPFPFSREPEAEAQLHRELGRRGLLPVEAWCAEPMMVWDRPFADLRSEVARELGLSPPSA